MLQSYLSILTALLALLSSSAYKSTSVKSTTVRSFLQKRVLSKSVLTSTSDYDSFASSLVGNAAAIKNRISSRISKPMKGLFPTTVTSRNSRLFEPIPVDYITGLEIKDFFPFFAVAFIALFLSALSRSFIPLQIIFTAEMLFVAFCAIISQFKLNVPAYHVELETDRDWDLLWGNVLKTVTCPREFFMSWFIQTRFEDIKREDAYDFLCWAMFSSLPVNLDGKQARSVERALSQIEHATTLKVNNVTPPLSATRRFPPRAADDSPLRSMRSSIEPLRWIHKPLSLYFVLQVLLGTVNVRYSLFQDGYQHKSAGKLNYWINMNDGTERNAKNSKDTANTANTAGRAISTNMKISEDMRTIKGIKGINDIKLESSIDSNTITEKSNNKISDKMGDKATSVKKNSRLPILFFHGIGGVFSYLKLIDGLTLFGCPIVIIEMPYVSLHVAPNVPTIGEHVSAVNQILDENNFDGAIIVGHSFGTTVMSWLVQAIPARIAGAVFLDPVVFMLHLRDISFNWMYGSVTNVGHKVEASGVEDIFGIVKTELFAANAVQRHFNWARNILWAHELHEREVESLVLVSGADKVVPSLEVHRHIEEFNEDMQRRGEKSYVGSEVFDTAGHGSLVFEEGYRSKCLKSIGEVVERSHVNWSNVKKKDYVSLIATATPSE